MAVFDMSRCTSEEFWPWNFIEGLKNGYLSITKYNSRNIMLKTHTRIVVFTNEMINMTRLSADRYDIYYLRDNKLSRNP